MAKGFKGRIVGGPTRDDVRTHLETNRDIIHMRSRSLQRKVVMRNCIKVTGKGSLTLDISWNWNQNYSNLAMLNLSNLNTSSVIEMLGK